MGQNTEIRNSVAESHGLIEALLDHLIFSPFYLRIPWLKATASLKLNFFFSRITEKVRIPWLKATASLKQHLQEYQFEILR